MRWNEMGDGRAEGSSAIGDGKQATIPPWLMLMAEVLVPCWKQIHVHLFES